MFGLGLSLAEFVWETVFCWTCGWKDFSWSFSSGGVGGTYSLGSFLEWLPLENPAGPSCLPSSPLNPETPGTML